jgi:predicted DNA-binding transcriptional regulator YafY
VVDPLGLAVKGSVWYLVAGTEQGQRTFRVDRIRTLQVSEDLVVRPEGFDLTSAWESITKDVDERRTPARARAIVRPESLSLLRWVFGRRLRIGPPRADGRVEIELRSASTRALAGEIAGFGRTIEVLEPEEIREHLSQIGHELSDLYGPNH